MYDMCNVIVCVMKFFDEVLYDNIKRWMWEYLVESFFIE